MAAHHSKTFSVIYCLLLSASYINSEFIYEEGEWETMIIDLITRALASIPIEEFVDDPQLRQKVDTVRKVSTYRSLNAEDDVDEDSKASKVYTRHSVDSLESIVVLRSQEDNLKVFHRKRTFVALRQNPLTNNTYFVSYVYLRFLTDKVHDCSETYLNERICVEYDTWDNDRGEVKTKHKYFGWTDCASSFFQTCQTGSKGNNSTRPAGSGPPAPVLEHSSQNDSKKSIQDEISYKPDKNVKYDDTIEAFWDLEVTPGEGRYIVETIKQTSVFNDPKAFVAALQPHSNTGGLGRSLSNSAALEGSVQKKLIREKAELQSQADEKNVNISRTLQQINGRKSWLLRKNELNSKLRKLCEFFGIGNYFEVKGSPEKMLKLRKIKEAKEILDELDALGDEFKINEIIDIKNDVGIKMNRVMPEVDADSQPASTSLTRSFGRSLSKILSKSKAANNTEVTEENTESKVAETIAKSVLFSSTDTFEKPGWKFSGSGGNIPEIMSKAEAEVFWGLGSCLPVNTQRAYQNIKNSAKPSASEVGDFYLAVLRTYCSKGAKNYLMYLIEEKYLKLDQTHFIIPFKLNLTSKLKLRPHELRKLSAALEISSFSKNYDGEINHNYNWTLEIIANPRAPSRSVHYLLEFGFIYLQQARKLMDNHFIKLCRNLVITFKGVMTKLLQDREILMSVCGSPQNAVCVNIEKTNRNDRLAVHSFLQFLTRGLAPVEQNKDAYIDGLMQSFQQTNLGVLKRSLEFYS